MKLNFKAIAVAAAMVAATSAHADLTSGVNGNSSFAMVAFNSVTNSYYVRDLGTTLNAFLPNSITTGSGDGAVTGNKTTDGTNIVWNDTNGNFASWLGTQNQADIRWTVAAGDGQGTAGATNVQRVLVALSSTPGNLPSNMTVRGAAGSANGVSGLATQNNDLTTWYDKTGAQLLVSFADNNAFGASTLGLLNTASSLFYYRATVGTLSNSAAGIGTQFAGTTLPATLTLSSAGVLTYDVAAVPLAAVPLPASVWMMGAGLAGMGAFMRRRAAAAKKA